MFITDSQVHLWLDESPERPWIMGRGINECLEWPASAPKPAPERAEGAQGAVKAPA